MKKKKKRIYNARASRVSYSNELFGVILAETAPAETGSRPENPSRRVKPRPSHIYDL